MQIFNFFIATLGSALSLVVLVVVLIHYLYLDVKPELIRDIPSLWLIAIIFGVIGTLAWFSAWAWARNHRYKWWIQASTVVFGTAGVFLLVATLK